MFLEQFSQALSRGFVALGTLALSACSSAGEDEPGVFVEVVEDAPHIVSFDEYRDAALVDVNGRRLYRVEWDLFFASENRLYDHYVSRVQEELDKSVVITSSTGQDLTWGRNTTALNIRYCVSTTFGSFQTQAINDLANATADWERVTNVNFIYKPSKNATCTGGTSGIDIAVMPHANLRNAYGTPPFLPSAALPDWSPFGLGTLVFDYASWPNWAQNGTSLLVQYPNLSTRGVMRHELGHILGLRHEHPWRPGGDGCDEPQVLSISGLGGRQLTAYDQGSVMHYPDCLGNASTSNSITELDGNGVRQLYGMPAAWYVPLLFGVP